MGKTQNVKALRTRDKVLAAKRIAMLTRYDDELWFRMRSGLTPEGAREEAEELLARFDLEARPSEEQWDKDVNLDVFMGSLERKVPGDQHPVIISKIMS